MGEPGDQIAIELDELEMRIRAVVGERDGFPAPGAVARTEGPEGGSSLEFERALARAAQMLSLAASKIADELRILENDMAANGAALIEADGMVAADLQSLAGLIDSIPEGRAVKSATTTATPTPTTATPDSASLG